MTFMRKFMDLLNMYNWNRYRSESIQTSVVSQKTSELNQRIELNKNVENVQNLYLFLLELRRFWKYYPQHYYYTSPEASTEEYEYYAKVNFLAAHRFLSSISRLENCAPTFLYKCRLSNPFQLFLDLLDDGYFEKASVTDILLSYKLDELKLIAESIGCKKSGRKQELAERICEHLSDDAKNELLSSCDSYVLSEKGCIYVDENSDYLELYKHDDYRVSLFEYNQQRFLFNRKRTFNDTIYQVLINRIYTESLQCHYRSMWQDYFSLYQISFSESRYDVAVQHFLSYLYFKCCCISAISLFDHSENYINYHEEIIFTFYDGKNMAALKNYYTDDLVDITFSFNYPPCLLQKNEFISLIHAMINQPVFNFEKYNAFITERIYSFAEINYDTV